MEPGKFDEATGLLLGGPKEKYGTVVVDLPVFKDGTDIISLWKPTWKERFSILFHGNVWVRARARDTHPPIGIQGKKTVFITQ